MSDEDRQRKMAELFRDRLRDEIGIDAEIEDAEVIVSGGMHADDEGVRRMPTAVRFVPTRSLGIETAEQEAAVRRLIYEVDQMEADDGDEE